MKLKIERTRKNGILGLLFVAAVVASFIAGGYISTGNLNPWGNKHYYQVLNANFQECHTLSGVSSCSTEHNVLFNAGALWVQQVTSAEAPTGGVCAPSTTCGFKYIAMSAGTTAPAAGDAVTGATNGDCGRPTDTELTTNGFGRAAGAVTDISGNSPKSSTVILTFTDATASQAVAKSCLVSGATPGQASNIQLAAATFTSITLQVGDTIQITWTLTWTWS